MGSDWVGVKVRKGRQEGVIIVDGNDGLKRILIAQMQSGKIERILLNNIGPNAKYVKQWSWYSEYRFKWVNF